MKYIETNSYNCYYNLALEEYILNTRTDDDYLILWQNSNTIVIGRNQDAYAEINLSEAERKNVNVVRRNTGGGAVYHDLGNLNFSFIKNWSKENSSYEEFLQPVIEVLNQLGIPAEKNGRNDLVVNGCKISGNAQCIENDRILHHGTLLFNSDISVMSEVLNPSKEKLESKGIKSVRSRVRNIDELTEYRVSINEFKKAFVSFMLKNNNLEIVKLKENELEVVTRLAKDKYDTWDWNFGKSPKSDNFKQYRFDGGVLGAHVEIQKGIIQNLKFVGDFLSLLDVGDIEKALIGSCVNEELSERLDKFELEMYFGTITKEEIISCII